MPADLDSIKKIEVPVIVQISRHEMSLREILALRPGSIIELPKSADDELEILVRNRRVGVGHAVKIGENFGVRISYVGNMKERVSAVGSELLLGGESEIDDIDADALAEQLLAGQ